MIENPAPTAAPAMRYPFVIAPLISMVGLIFIALITLWLGQISASVYGHGADAFTIRAVLRADTSKVAAEKLAGKIYQQIPTGHVEVINEAMGRSLLALQEPWIAQMPDFEVTPLPILLEIHHPELLTDPGKVVKFVKDLGKQPEVDFVAYNETAHDRLVKFATASAAIETHTMRWMLMTVAILGLTIMTLCFSGIGRVSVLGIFTWTLTLWAPGWFIGWLLYRGWEAVANATGDWMPLAFSVHLKIGIAALLITLTAAIINFAVNRLRP